MNIHVPDRIARLPRFGLTVADCFRLTEEGVVHEDDRFELLYGEVVRMASKNIRHERVKQWLNFWLADQRHQYGYGFIGETTFRLSDETFVEPDFVLHPPNDLENLSPETALLAIEVSDTSLAYDLGRKARVYADHGVRELWVVNVRTLDTIVHREPSSAGYASVVTVPHGTSVGAAYVAGLALDLSEYS